MKWPIGTKFLYDDNSYFIIRGYRRGIYFLETNNRASNHWYGDEIERSVIDATTKIIYPFKSYYNAVWEK